MLHPPVLALVYSCCRLIANPYQSSWNAEETSAAATHLENALESRQDIVGFTGNPIPVVNASDTLTTHRDLAEPSSSAAREVTGSFSGPSREVGPSGPEWEPHQEFPSFTPLQPNSNTHGQLPELRKAAVERPSVPFDAVTKITRIAPSSYKGRPLLDTLPPELRFLATFV
ncbi:MAG: hypothetical protein JO182_00165, partial [Acidobacteriaceae bacterium]|nr:hypothetical protein [Acidobacteriaceae bacterium]